MLGPDGALYVSTSNGDGADLILRITVNTPPTGAPAITGIAEVGEELTANTSGIADGDGLSNVSYVNTSGSAWPPAGWKPPYISGATSDDLHSASRPTWAVSFEGPKVRFTDDKGNPESAGQRAHRGSDGGSGEGFLSV